MKKTSKTIIFFGNERLATGVTTTAPTLRALIDAGYHVAAVVSHQEHGGRSRNARTLEMELVAREHKIPFLVPTHVSDLHSQVKQFGAQLGVLVAYGKIVPQAIIDAFPRGIVNIHPSLLPLHRGPIPIESAILEGALKTGVSIMQLVKAMDAGPLFGQKEILLSGKESKQALTNTLLYEGGGLLLGLLPSILDGSAKATAQDNKVATYDQLLSADDGVLDWQKPAERLEREVRAFAGWPRSRTRLADKDVVVTKAHVVENVGIPGQLIISGRTLSVSTKHNALSLDSLIPSGKKEMDIGAFLAGYGNALR